MDIERHVKDIAELWNSGPVYKALLSVAMGVLFIAFLALIVIGIVAVLYLFANFTGAMFGLLLLFICSALGYEFMEEHFGKR